MCRDMRKFGDRGKDRVDHCLEEEQRQICRSIGNLKKMLKKEGIVVEDMYLTKSIFRLMSKLFAVPP